MAEYVRFVSYLYAYQQDVRGANVGFVKYEVRSGLKRLLVQVNGIRRANNRLQIYAFYRDYHSCIGIKLGTLILKNGRGTFQYSTYADSIGNTDDSECKFEEISGMVVTGDNAGDMLFASVWDNEAFSTEMFVRNRQELMTFRAAELEPEEDVAQQDDAIRAELSAQEEREEARQPANEPQNGEDNPENVSTEIPVSPEMPTVPTAPQTPEQPMSPANGNGSLSNTQPFGLRRQTVWDRLCKMYPKVMPFPYDRKVRCLRMRPNDLGRLPRANWTLANNSFLLHGFFQYRYILLLKIYGDSEEYEERYMLAVPGVYSGMDRHLAEMFGFPEFKSSPWETVRDGQFGFWMREVYLEN